LGVAIRVVVVGVLGPVNDGDVAMGGRWELGARCRGCWGSSTSVTWQLRPVRFGVQAARGGVMGGVTHLGCTQWVLVVVVGGDGGGWW